MFKPKGRNQVYAREATPLQCTFGLQLRCLRSYLRQDVLSCEPVRGYPLCCVICVGNFDEAVACADMVKLRLATLGRRSKHESRRQCQVNKRNQRNRHRPEARTLLLILHLGLEALALGAVN